MSTQLSDLKKLLFILSPWDRIFLKGIPGAGKTTFAQELIRQHLWDDTLVVISPTYTYYQKYGDNVYHFDLYRAKTLTDIMRIGADEIFEDPDAICLIEWPDLIDAIITPTKVVDIVMGNGERDFIISDVKV